MKLATRAALRDLGRLLLPARCPGCGGAVALQRGVCLVCPGCAGRLRSVPWPRCPRCDAPRGTGRASEADCLHCRGWPDAVTRARAAVVLEDPARGLVHAFKYGGQPDLAPFLAARMVACLPRVRAGDVVTWVPTTPRRLRRRGYDQAGTLARAVARMLELPLLSFLERTREGPSQVSLPPEQRRSNVQGAFRLAAGPSPRGAHVLLVDDVLTTGASVGEAARVLERAGASGVGVLTFARALADRTRTA